MVVNRRCFPQRMSQRHCKWWIFCTGGAVLMESYKYGYIYWCWHNKWYSSGDDETTYLEYWGGIFHFWCIKCRWMHNDDGYSGGSVMAMEKVAVSLRWSVKESQQTDIIWSGAGGYVCRWNNEYYLSGVDVMLNVRQRCGVMEKVENIWYNYR